MHTLQLLLLAGSVALAAGQSPACVGGEMVGTCCQCFEGYKGESCNECDEGYVALDIGGVLRCGSGRPGTQCSDATWAAYPFWGCKDSSGAALGECTTDVSGNSVFPCVCEGESCDAKMVARESTANACYPAGARMYTTFPNDPLADQPFDLTVVGCALSKSSKYLVLPESQRCENQPTQWDAAAACKKTNGGAGVKAMEGDCLSTGVSIEGLEQADRADAKRSGMSEATFKNLQVNQVDSKFRVCARERDAATRTTRWVELPAANSRDDSMFRVCSDLYCGGTGGEGINGAAGADAGPGDECPCTEGLMLGDTCIHNLIVIILFLLVLCVLGVLLYRRNALQTKLQAFTQAMRQQKKEAL